MEKGSENMKQDDFNPIKEIGKLITAIEENEPYYNPKHAIIIQLFYKYAINFFEEVVKRLAPFEVNPPHLVCVHCGGNIEEMWEFDTSGRVWCYKCRSELMIRFG